jgi:hypothetical protein
MKTSLKHKVEYTLEHHKSARNCDNLLIANFLLDWYPQHFDGYLFDMRELKELPNLYDVIRYRKIIQNKDGLYEADQEVKQKRFNKQIDTRRELGFNPEFIYPL